MTIDYKRYSSAVVDKVDMGPNVPFFQESLGNIAVQTKYQYTWTRLGESNVHAHPDSVYFPIQAIKQ